MKKLLIPVVLACSSTLLADFSLNVNFGAIYNTSLSDSLGVNKIGVLVVSTLGNPFPQGAALSNLSLASGSDWGDGNFVMTLMASQATTVDQDGNASTPAETIHLFGGTTDNVSTSGFGGNFTVGDKFALYWFPNITDTNAATGIGNASVTPSRTIQPGDNYGFYRSDVVQNGALVTNNTSFAAGSLTGTAIRLHARSALALTPTQEATVGTSPMPANSEFVANLVVIPEPSTYALMGLGLVVVGLIARRKKS